MKLSTIVAATLMAGVSTVAAAETVMRYADHGSNRGARAASTSWFLDQIEERTDIKIDAHWGGALLGAKTMLDGLENEVATFGTLIGSYYPKDFVAWRVGDLPLEVPNEVAGAMTVHELLSSNPIMVQEFERKGLKYLAGYTVGPVQMICNTDAITEAGQFDGLKVRYAGAYGDILAKFGATPVALSLSKSYEALDTGLIDCSQAYGYLVPALKLNEVARTFVVFDAGTLQSNALVMNLDAFEALPEETQATLLEIGREMTENNAITIRNANQKTITSMAENDDDGVEVSYLSDQAKQDLRDASMGSVDKWLEEASKAGIDGQAVLDAYTTLLAENLKKYGD